MPEKRLVAEDKAEELQEPEEAPTAERQQLGEVIHQGLILWESGRKLNLTHTAMGIL